MSPKNREISLYWKFIRARQQPPRHQTNRIKTISHTKCNRHPEKLCKAAAERERRRLVLKCCHKINVVQQTVQPVEKLHCQSGRHSLHQLRRLVTEPLVTAAVYRTCTTSSQAAAQHPDRVGKIMIFLNKKKITFFI